MALEAGADGIEFDVRFTRDGVVVLQHDAVLSRFGAVIDRSLADLRERIPTILTLDDVLDHAGTSVLNVEIKNHPRDPDFDPHHRLADVVVEWISANDIVSRTLVSSFNRETVARVQQLDARVVTGLLLEHGGGINAELTRAVHDGHTWLLPRRSAFRLSPKRLVARAHREGMLIGAWTVDGPRELRRLGDAGIDAVITNDPGKARNVYE